MKSCKRNCAACDAEFIPHKKTPWCITCSKKCRANYRHRKKKGLPLKTLTLKCEVCGDVFKQKRANNNTYCSQTCKRLGVSRKYKNLPVFGPKKHIRGTGYLTSSGYKMVSANHPRARMRSQKTGNGQILEHILIMEKDIGRYLREDESVHHKNGIRSDNRIENLELWSKTTHGQHQRFGQRLNEKMKSFIEFLESYGCRIERSEFVSKILSGQMGEA